MALNRLVFALALGAMIALAGCGRKGPLDTPYQAAVDARKQAKEDGKPVPPEPKKPEEDRPFILDPLIQ